MFLKDAGPLYFTGWCLYNLFFRIFFRFRVEGREKIPGTGALIIASNHVSSLDPPVIGSALKRGMFYMAKRELFSNPVFGWVLRRVNAFPVDRSGADVHAFREARRLLEEGKILLLFPQGGRRAAENLRAEKGGVGMLACMAQVPVVPCAVISAKSVEGARGITVRFSSPLQPPPECGKEGYREFSEEVMRRIREMLYK
jgi:1-acyl-sn-glycerol-3-phosphate acyltransferase